MLGWGMRMVKAQGEGLVKLGFGCLPGEAEGMPKSPNTEVRACTRGDSWDGPWS